MSSVQDRLTGLALRETENLNWATTAFYYSAVHAGRLLCFLCAGDYPMGHADMANLFAAGASGRVRFDWLETFQAYVAGAGPTQQITDTQADARVLRPSLEAAVRASFPSTAAAVASFAPLLSKFKKLRNDCNYEAFLVAHERNHFLVTPGFDDLARAADRASAMAVEMAVSLASESMSAEPAFGPSRALFIASHNHYVRGRLEESLAEKFRHSPSAMSELRTVRDALRVSPVPGPTITADDVDTFLHEIEYGQFGQKQGLMDRWRQDVAALKTSVGL